MAGKKILIGPKLRELRASKDLTQAQLALSLGVSASYINLIERNQRSASLKFLITLSDTFGIDWRQLTNTESGLALADLRNLTKDPAFGDQTPDIEELRSALEGSPNLVRGFTNIFKAYRSYGERLAEQNEALANIDPAAMESEHTVHDFFRQNNNYFDVLESSARIFSGKNIENAALYSYLKSYLDDEFGISVEIAPIEKLGSSLRLFDKEKSRIFLSEGLDYLNRVFQLAHSLALIAQSEVLNALLDANGVNEEHARAKCRVELANYFAAAFLMPYDQFYETALNSKYDIEYLATRFSVSYEHVCQRLTTLQRPGKRGVPFFFLRIDKGGNVSKRFNVTRIQLARYGGACPRLDVHYSFRVPSRILTQTVEMPDNSRYLTINRTVDRPSFSYSNEDKRLAVSLGCPVEYAPYLVYGHAAETNAHKPITEVGVNCRLCPRLN
ncbi:MAG: helix-turn-helix domain-containing protein, partial [Alphaproteobacteria bacterium]